MKKSSKVIATIAIIVGFILIFGLFESLQGPGGKPMGILGIILLIGVIVGIRAIWKTQEDSKEIERKKKDIDDIDLRKD